MSPEAACFSAGERQKRRVYQRKTEKIQQFIFQAAISIERIHWIVDAKSSFLFLEKSAAGFFANSHGSEAISWISDKRLFFTCSANIISVTSKNVIHLRGFAANFSMYVKCFLKNT